MKRLFFFFLALCFSATAYAAKPQEFALQFEGERIIHNQSDWQYVTKADSFRVYVERGMIGYHNEMYEFHSYIEFNEEFQIDGISDKIKRIYSYGVLNCSEANLYLLMDLFTNEKGDVKFRSVKEFGSHVSELKTPNTIRHEVYNLLCKDSV